MRKITLIAITFLIVGITGWAQPNWSVNSRVFENSMNITGVISMNDVESKNAGNIVGAFVDNECRGIGKVTFVPSLNRYLVFLTLYGNNTTGQIDFKIYWKETNTIYDLSEKINFEINGTLGSPEEPYNWTVIEGAVSGKTTKLSGCDGTVYILTAETGAIKYKWNTGSETRSVSVSGVGTYSCTRTLASGAQIIDYWIIEVLPSPLVDLGDSIAVGEGESLVLDAQNTGASYAWSTGETTQVITVTLGDTYSVTVTNSNGCSSTDEIIVSINSAIAYTKTFSGCKGDVISLDATHADASTYSWDTGENVATIDVAQDTTKTVEITLVNGSKVTGTFHATFNISPNIEILDTIKSCAGVSLTIDAGNPGSSFLWNTGETSSLVTLTQGGQYSVEVTNQFGCKSQKDITVEFLSPTTFDFGSEIIQTCSDQLVELDPQIENMQYLWSTGDTTQSIIPMETGLYSLNLTNKGGCESSEQIYVIIEKNEPSFIEKTIFEGESYQFYDNELAKTGIYTHIDSSYNCPKKIILNLTVIKSGDVYGKLSGVIEYDKTEQLGEIILLLRSPENQKTFATQTQSNGSFIFDAVLPGDYLLCAMVGHLNLPGSPADCYYNDALDWENASSLLIEEGNTNSVTLILNSNQTNNSEYLNLNSLHSIIGSVVCSASGEEKGIFRSSDEQKSAILPQQAIRIVLFKSENGSIVFFQSVLTNEDGEYSFKNIPSGDYLVEVDIPGLTQHDHVSLCFEGTSTSDVVNFEAITSFPVTAKTNHFLENIKVSPNPCTEFLNIELSSNVFPSLLKIFDLNGKCLMKRKLTETHNYFDIRELNQGMYILKVGNETTQHFKLIVK